MMRITRRRQRQPDPFASPDWVRSVFVRLKAAFPLLSPLKEKDMIRLGRAVRHVERYSATDTRRGRPSRWRREELVRVGLRLTDLLRRETSGRMSLAGFKDSEASGPFPTIVRLFQTGFAAVKRWKVRAT